METAEVLNNFFLLCSLVSTLPTSLKSPNLREGTGRMKSLPDYKRRLGLSIHKSMGPNKIYSRVLRQLADVAAEILSIIFKK